MLNSSLEGNYHKSTHPSLEFSTTSFSFQSICCCLDQSFGSDAGRQRSSPEKGVAVLDFNGAKIFDFKSSPLSVWWNGTVVNWNWRYICMATKCLMEVVELDNWNEINMHITILDIWEEMSLSLRARLIFGIGHTKTWMICCSIHL